MESQNMLTKLLKLKMKYREKLKEIFHLLNNNINLNKDYSKYSSNDIKLLSVIFSCPDITKKKIKISF